MKINCFNNKKVRSPFITYGIIFFVRLHIVTVKLSLKNKFKYELFSVVNGTISPILFSIVSSNSITEKNVCLYVLFIIKLERF